MSVTDVEKLKVYKEKLKPLLENELLDEETFEELASNFILLEYGLGIINSTFIDNLYTKDNNELSRVSREAEKHIMNQFTDVYVETCLSDKKLVALPESDVVFKWLEESHLNIAKQVYAPEVVENSIAGVIKAISEAIAESLEELPEELEKEARSEKDEEV
jgi:hypothetical protein